MNYLYFIRCESFIKIGITGDVRNRLRDLATSNPFPLSVISYFRFRDARELERVFHIVFRGKRNNLEWFVLDEHDLALAENACIANGGEKMPSFDYNAPARATTERPLPVIHDDGYALDELRIADTGWRIEKTRGGTHWQWRKGSGRNRISLPGGKFGSPKPLMLASPDDEQWKELSAFLEGVHFN